ncbi:MAG: SPOR domain-containing protein [Novosphingobium sp.]
MRLPVDRILPISAFILLAACGGATHAEVAAPRVTAGPAADYPIVIGVPFTIDGVTYTPADKLNVDQVGYAYSGSEGGTAISGAHRTLPVPSYVEVTSLDTGKTILVRLERRGPMTGDGLIELSPGATAQLGVSPAGKTPVRVRRVNPPEIERAALRRGERAPDRMDTPKSLVAVLLRKLNPGLPGAAVAPSTPSAPPASLAALSTRKPLAPATKPARPAVAQAVAAPKPAAAPRPAAVNPAPATARGGSIVQVGAFSSKANAEASAAKVGGSVSPSGRLWRVRMGPYAAQNEAAAAMAKAKGAGYSDARIQRAD